MVDQEVVDILKEIKERVSVAAAEARDIPEQTSIDLSSNRIDYPGLTVLARTWNRLPPLVSNRSGTSAKLELWLKAKLDRAFRWFTWEQVNFNAGARQTLIQIVDSLNAHQQQLAALNESQAHQEEINRESLSRQQQLRALIDAHEAYLAAQRSLLATLHTEVSGQATAITQIQTFNDQVAETKSQLQGLIDEIRERDERLSDEQRVCFKQLSLELSELQIVASRTQRELETRIAKVESTK